MITLTINGQRRELESSANVLQFLESLQLPTKYVAIARNGVILHRQEYDKVLLQEGDALEIVRMVGGG